MPPEDGRKYLQQTIGKFLQEKKAQQMMEEGKDWG